MSVVRALGLTVYVVLGPGASPTIAEPALPSNSWPMYQFSSNHNAVFDLPHWDVAWKADIGARNNGGLAIVGGTLFVESFDHKMFAFDALTGVQQWEQTVDDIAMATPLVDGDLVYGGSGEGGAVFDDGVTYISGRPEGNAVYAFARTTGRIVWTQRTIGQDMPSGTLVRLPGGTALIFHNGDDHVRALDARTGATLWEKRTPGFTTMSSLALYQGAVYGITGASRQQVWAAEHNRDARAIAHRSWSWSLDPQSGRFAWTSPYGWCDSSPTVAAGEVFVENTRIASGHWIRAPEGAYYSDKTVWRPDASTTFYSEVSALDATTGRLIWKYASASGRQESAGSAVSAASGVYVGGTYYHALPFANELAAFNAKTGAVLWRMHSDGQIKMGGVVKDGRLYVGDAAGMFYVVSTDSGRIEQKVQFPGAFGYAPPVIVGSTLFMTNMRTLYALRLSDLQRGAIAAP